MKTTQTKHKEKRAVLYCRVSTKEQVEEGTSLAMQERLGREYAAAHGYQIAYVFVEEGESAKTADRTQLKELFRYCSLKTHRISTVLIYKIDRISRNTDDYSYIRLFLKRYGVEIQSITERFEDSPSGRFMENIIANVAQFDNEIRAERSIGGMREAVREGRYVWQGPIGYQNVRVDGKATIAPSLFAPYIVQLFELIATQKYSLSIVRERINASLTSDGHTVSISKSYFHILIRNKLYTGWIEKFGEVHRGAFTPLISDELFHKVQYILLKKKRQSRIYFKSNPFFPLTKLVVDDYNISIRGSFSQGRSKKYPYYFICSAKKLIRKELLEEQFFAFLETFQYTIDDFKRLIVTIKAYTHSTDIEHMAHTMKTREQIAELKKQRTYVITEAYKETITKEAMKDAMFEIDQQIEACEQVLTMKVKKYDTKELTAFAHWFLSSIAKRWKDAPHEIKLELQSFLFPKKAMYSNGSFSVLSTCLLLGLKEGRQGEYTKDMQLKLLEELEQVRELFGKH